MKWFTGESTIQHACGFAPGWKYKIELLIEIRQRIYNWAHKPHKQILFELPTIHVNISFKYLQ